MKTVGLRPAHYTFASLCLLTLVCLASGLAPFASHAAGAQGSVRALSLEERVAHQRAVEEIYWRRTIWPSENSRPKPSLDELMPVEVTRAKVEDTLRKSEALAQRWNRPVTAEQLQAELTRMARETRQPEVLRELWSALGDDPFVIAEVLARPALVDRLARNSFDADAKTAAPEGSKAKAPQVTFDAWWDGASRQFAATEATADEGFVYQLAEVSNAAADDVWQPTQALPVATGTAVWTGSELIVWGGLTSYGGRTNSGSRYNPATDTWTSTGTVGAPLPRAAHTAVWTGSEMLVYGGSLGSGTTNSGGRYNPSTDTWTPTSTTGALFRSGHTAVWTGKMMVIFGGCTITGSDACRIGGVYDPASDTWKTTTLTNAPTHRVGHRAVWTGSEMIVWGGSNVTAGNTGSRYNPDTDTWTPTNTFNAPSWRSGFSMVWTGTEAVVWGGYEGNFVTLNTGGRYNPATDTWTPTSTTNSAAARYGHTAVWSGSEMIVYGGDLRPGGQSQLTNTGARYNPINDSWTATSTTNAPVKFAHVAVWAGTEMLAWGGQTVTGVVQREAARYTPSNDSWLIANKNDAPLHVERGVWTGAEVIVWGYNSLCNGCNAVGGRYDPATNVWKPMNLAGGPTASGPGAAHWTGKEMLVWGGGAGRYNPLTDTWAPISNTNAPRACCTSVWTGSEMIVWGSNDPATADTGGRYNPESDTWTPTSTVGAPSGRSIHTAVWTGTEMVVWGGAEFAGPRLNTGGRYNPATDTWAPTSTVNAPTARMWHTAIWTGSEMVVWGGTTGDANSNQGLLGTGGRYNPSTDSWTPTGVVGAPEARSYHRAVWTGSQMIVWGGYVNGVNGPYGTYTGARYNPSTDVWTRTSTLRAPSKRAEHVQVWTGTQMFVWGGTASEGAATHGAIYNAPGAAPGGNLPPTVRLTAPAVGASYQSGDNVTINTEVSDPDGSVATVRFYANDALIATDTQAPFGFDWGEVRGGSYALTATATDDSGAETRSAAVNISVTPSTAPPVCALTSPADGATYAYGASVRMEATAASNRDRSISKVEFIDNDVVVSSYSTPTYNAPWGFTYLAPASGTHNLAARCTDSTGAATTSAVRVVTVGENGFTISGQVLDERGFIVAGVRVRLDGPVGTEPQYATTTVRNNGNYFFNGLKQGATYTVTPEPGAWTFSPASKSFPSLSGDKSSQNFIATQAGYGISGYLRDAGGNPIYPATVNLSGSKTATTNVSSDGSYFFSNLAAGGTYTVQPYKNLYTFEPGFRTYENLGAEQTANFTGTPHATSYAVAGRVVDDKGAPVAGLRVRLDTVRVTSTQYRTTDAMGRYSFGTIQAGENLTVAPEDFTYAYNFTPANRMYIELARDVADADFVATPRTVSGRVTQSGSGLQGVTVTLGGPQGGTVTTGEDGAFAFRNITMRGDYTVTASKPGYTLTPAEHALKDLKEDVTADFAVALRLDVSGDFVTQHYRDFLNREPDASGLNHWTNEIEQCGSDAQCREVRRINVSAAFFLSIEFQETGFLAYRAHKAAFGDLAGKPVPITRAEMLQDMQVVGGGLVVGPEGWELKLEQNKQVYFDRLVSSARFNTAYPQTLTPEQFVDALNANADGALSSAERDALVAALKNDAKTRAQALRVVAEDADLNAAEKSKAFVLMQYFGYLRRNPDDAPDADFGGWHFWLSKLNEFQGNYISAEMVKAFLSADEYKNRFAR